MQGGFGRGWHLIVSCCGAHSNPRKMQMDDLQREINVTKQKKGEKLNNDTTDWEKAADIRFCINCRFETALISTSWPESVSSESSPHALKPSAKRRSQSIAGQWTHQHAASASAGVTLHSSWTQQSLDSSCQTDTLLHFSLPETSQPDWLPNRTGSV